LVGALGRGCSFYGNIKGKLETIEGELNLSLCLNVRYAKKSRGRMEIWLHAILISVLEGDEFSASHRGRFTAEEIVSGTNWVGGWKEFRVSQDV